MASTHKPKGGRKPVVRWREGGVQRSLSFDTQKEAEKHRARLVLAGVQGRAGSPVALESAVATCIAGRKVTCSRITYRTYLSYARAISERFGPAVRVDKINTGHIEDWRNQLAESLSPKTVINYIKAASAFFTFCIHRKWIYENPCHGVAFPKYERKIPNWLDDSEVFTLLRYVTEPANKCPLINQAFIILAAEAGLRTGDSRKLRKEDLDFAGRRIHVNRGKSKKPRSVRMTELVRWFFMDRWTSEGEWLFPKQRDRGPDHDEFVSANISITVNEWLRTHGFNIRLHGLRHSLASRLLAGGLGTKDVAEILGHSSTQTTEIYLHGKDDVQSRHVEARGMPLPPCATVESAGASPSDKPAESSEHARQDSSQSR